MSFPRYPKYRDSGIAWLGSVPEHWKVKRLRFAAAFNPSKSELVDVDRTVLASFLPMEAVGDDGSLDLSRERPIVEVEMGYTYFRDGDVAFAKITPCFENGKGAVMQGLTNGIGFGTTELIIARPFPNEVSSEYLHLLFSSSQFRQAGEAHMYGAGGQKRVPDAVVRDLPVALPPKAEQRAIANFLRTESAKVDALITKQRRLIQLLSEKRQAIISHAVTKGLDAHATMKPSGVEWLGDVPIHWRLHRLKWSVASCKNGVWGADPQGDELDIPCVRVADFDRKGLRVVLVEPTIRSVAESEREGRILSRGDLLLEKSGGGENQPVGCVVLYEDSRAAVCSNFVARVRLASDQDSSFWRYVHAAAYAVRINVRSIKQTSGIQNLDNQQYFDEVVGFPPAAEQRAIAAFLDGETAKIDALVAESERVVNLLQERRAALIVAATTGRIDIRGLGDGKAG